jgi:hypothetical protein
MCWVGGTIMRISREGDQKKFGEVDKKITKRLTRTSVRSK